MSYREPCRRTMLPLMGVRFLRGATFLKRDQIDCSLDWAQPYEGTTPTQTDRSLSLGPLRVRGLGKVTADTRLKGSAADDKV